MADTVTLSAEEDAESVDAQTQIQQGSRRFRMQGFELSPTPKR